MSLDVRAGKRVTGEDCAVWPLGIPIRIPTLEGAVDDALEKGGGNTIRTEGTVLDSSAAR